MRGINNLEYRVNQIDKFGVDIQILSLRLPTLDDLSNVPVQEFKKITKAANDGIARIAEHSNGRFKGITTVSLLEVGDAIEEVGSGIEVNIAPALPDSIHGTINTKSISARKAKGI